MQFILIMYAPHFLLNSSQIRQIFTPPQPYVLVFIAHHLQLCCPGTLGVGVVHCHAVNLPGTTSARTQEPQAVDSSSAGVGTLELLSTPC